MDKIPNFVKFTQKASGIYADENGIIAVFIFINYFSNVKECCVKVNINVRVRVSIVKKSRKSGSEIKFGLLLRPHPPVLSAAAPVERAAKHPPPVYTARTSCAQKHVSYS